MRRIGGLLAHLATLERGLADELRAAAERHRDVSDIHYQCLGFARSADDRAARLEALGRSGGASGDCAEAMPKSSCTVTGAEAPLTETSRGGPTTATPWACARVAAESRIWGPAVRASILAVRFTAGPTTPYFTCSALPMLPATTVPVCTPMPMTTSGRWRA